MSILTNMQARFEADMLRTFGLSTTNIEEERPPLTADTILATMRELAAAPPVPRIIYSVYALETSDEPAFPPSRHRSARIRKKLIKRHGGEFRKKPAMWQIGNDILAHPAMRTRVENLFR